MEDVSSENINVDAAGTGSTGIIMSVEQCEQVEADLVTFKTKVTDFNDTVSGAINTFNNNEIVQSFYASGSFGSTIQEKLSIVSKAVTDYYNAITADNGLVPVTERVVASYKERLNSTNGGVTNG